LALIVGEEVIDYTRHVYFSRMQAVAAACGVMDTQAGRGMKALSGFFLYFRGAAFCITQAAPSDALV
jgi:hypothetical protein